MHHNITLCLRPVAKCKDSESFSEHEQRPRRKEFPRFERPCGVSNRMEYFKVNDSFAHCPVILPQFPVDIFQPVIIESSQWTFWLKYLRSAVIFYLFRRLFRRISAIVVARTASILRSVNIFQTGRCAFGFRSDAQNSQCEDYWIIYFYY